MSINFGQFPTPRLPLQGNDLVVGYQLIGSVPTLAQYTLTQMFVGAFPGGVVPIVNGGTGATTAPQALTNLGAASLLTNTFAGNQTISVFNATLTLDDANGGSSANVNFNSQGIPQWQLRSVAFNGLFLDRFVGGVFVNSPISVDQTSGTVNLPLVGITGGSINGTTVGAATPSSGAFTTVTASGLITPAQLAGIKGTTTNNNANAGSVGEFVTATATVALTSGVISNTVSAALTAGDWEISGSIAFTPTGGAAPTALTAGINTVSVTFPAAPFVFLLQTALPANAQQGFVVPPNRFSLAAPATMFMATQANFASGACSATAVVRARRVR